MSRDLNQPPPGGWPVGAVCVITFDSAFRNVGEEVLIRGAAEPLRKESVAQWQRPISPGVLVQRCRHEPSGYEAFWPSAWMRPLRDPDTELNRETEREVSDAIN
jgi:hypothetical protein